jgi:hypothetical protein
VFDEIQEENGQRAATAQFLSIYSITRGTVLPSQPQQTPFASVGWTIAASNLVDDGTSKIDRANALFSDLIQRVHVGDAYSDKNPIVQNSLPNIRSVLGSLGVQATPTAGHQNHFHVYLRPPSVLKIGGNNLLADASKENTAMFPVYSIDVPPSSPIIVAQAAPDPVVPVVPGSWFARANFTRDIRRSYTLGFEYGVRQFSSNSDRTKFENDHQASFSENGNLGIPVLRFRNEVELFRGKDVNGRQSADETNVDLRANACFAYDVLKRQLGGWGPECNLERIISQPPGKFTKGGDEFSEAYFQYTKTGRFTWHYVVNNGAGRRMEVIATVDIKLGGEAWDYRKLRRGDLKMGSLSSETESSINFEDTGVSFENLPGASVGETRNGDGIVLDATAAGRDWFVDSTPESNDEFLPTADANIFIAKEGSAASGKMDMLSVLLHEYGHVLGIEHNPDSRDFMSPALQAGVRKLPTADELQLMADLVAQLNANTGVSNATSGSSSVTDGSDSPARLPLGLALGVPSIFAFMRRPEMQRLSAGWLLGSAEPTPPADASDLLLAANATLQNASFAGTANLSGWTSPGWSVSGPVSPSLVTLNGMTLTCEPGSGWRLRADLTALDRLRLSAS